MATALVNPASADAESSVESGPRLLTIEEFEGIPNSAFPEGTRLELIEGLIYEKMGQNDPYRFAVHYAARALRAAFGPEFDLMLQPSLRLSEHSNPVPDVFVFPGTLEDYESRVREARQDVTLVVEVSDTTLADDRGRKARLYAKHGLPEYWIVNLNARTLEVRRGPRAETADWFETLVYREGETATATATANGKTVAVADLLPKA